MWYIRTYCIHHGMYREDKEGLSIEMRDLQVPTQECHISCITFFVLRVMHDNPHLYSLNYHGYQPQTSTIIIMYPGFCPEWMEWWSNKPRIGPQLPENVYITLQKWQLFASEWWSTGSSDGRSDHHEPLWAEHCVPQDTVYWVL